jgi:molybdenum cofactor cytidylyltransferase
MIVAIVPAAGLSLRMGRPKPLLDLGGSTLIAHVVRALRDGGADRVVVVAPPDGRPESAAIAREAERAGAEVIVLGGETPDMRASIEAGLELVERGGPPLAVLLTPADQPGLSPTLVDRVIRAGRDARSMARPRSGSKRGHPVYLPWSVALEIRRLPGGTGVDALVDDPARAVAEFEVDDGDSLLDVDTPDDFRRWSVAGAD